MKTYIASSLFAALVCAAAPTFASVPADLVNNGTFEDISGSPFGSYITLDPASSYLVGWKVGGTSVDLIRAPYFGAIDGISVDMLGSPGPGSLSQTLTTVIGQSYKLSFDLSKNPEASTAEQKTLEVSLTGASTKSYIGAATVAHEVLTFTATSASTVLTFAANAQSSWGAVLDNVSVTAVPEPESYAMLLAGLGLMVTMARRRSGRPA